MILILNLKGTLYASDYMKDKKERKLCGIQIK